jgi:hypothetical protein
MQLSVILIFTFSKKNYQLMDHLIFYMNLSLVLTEEQLDFIPMEIFIVSQMTFLLKNFLEIVFIPHLLKLVIEDNPTIL